MSNIFEDIEVAFEVTKAFDDCEIKAADDGTYDFLISASKKDMEGDIVDADGGDFSYYKKIGMPLLSDHMASRDSTIGKASSVRHQDGQIFLKGVKFLDHQPAQLAKYLVDEGLTRPSIRFFPKADEGSWERITHKDGTSGYHYHKWVLVETSLVVLPAYQDARRVKEICKNFGQDIVDSIAKGAVAYQNFSLDKESSWDASRARAQLLRWAGGPDKDNVDWAKYRKGFVWFDSSEPKSISSYKLPIAYIEGGSPVAVWRGVTAAMAVLLGARGGVSIPASDRRAVYNHLAKYYKKADKTPPDFKVLSDEEIFALSKIADGELMELLDKQDKYFQIFDESGNNATGIFTEETERQIERLSSLLSQLKQRR